MESDVRIVSAHRTPDVLFDVGRAAHEQGYRVLIAGAGGAAHLPGMLAALSPLPVIGVPMKGGISDGLDALLSTVQMPAGIPVATVAVGSHGARNAAILALQILALSDEAFAKTLADFRVQQTADVPMYPG